MGAQSGLCWFGLLRAALYVEVGLLEKSDEPWGQDYLAVRLIKGADLLWYR